MSADQGNDYFCDGLAEELLNALAQLDGLKVAARTSFIPLQKQRHNDRSDRQSAQRKHGVGRHRA
jgi:TolB-like protein